MISIQQVNSKKDLATFIDFPHSLYKDDVNYVPELFIAQRDILTPGKHPFHEHSKMQLFLAYENELPVGRVAAILNNNHNKFKSATDGFYGFFDAVDNIEVAKKLFDVSGEWLKKNGATTMIGPVNPTTNDACGLLVEGFDKPPVAMMTYNKPYYAVLMEAVGLIKQNDLLAYDLRTKNVFKKAVELKETILNRLAKRNITLRPINLRDFKNEVKKVKEVYNAAWEKNTGFVPMTDAEFDYLGKDMKQILDKDFCMLAEHNGKIIGFALAIPDINQVLIKIKRGRLFPTGIFKLLFGLKKINYVRVLALGVEEEYRRMGIEACFYADLIQKSIAKNIIGGEASWILENNLMMKKGLDSLNAVQYKRYRIYQKSI
ncbi:MAG: hypothetical protein ABIQ56_02925 [Chitinophagaceae bacterium]